ncbi:MULTISPECIES: hypothetical protein [unclassified Chitinophaga]|uniref:hypothetical protein n=1 Tax=unclassified Chitinophaga TaxID=2619133 RepID=UPI0030100D8F
MIKVIFSFSVLLCVWLPVKAQTDTFSTLNFPNTYANTITTGLYSANFRSGFIYQSSASINFGLTGLKASNFRFRWLAHDNGAIDYSADTDQLMFLDGNGNLNLKGALTANGNIGIGMAPTADKLAIDMGATRGGVNFLSDGDANAYMDLKFTVKTATGIATGKPLLWEASLRKDGYFSADVSGPTLEFYAVRQGTGYYAPLLFKSNGDIILAGAQNATNGNVGIGTTDTKGYKLAVNGDAIFTRIKVKANTAWPDFVFAPGYDLPALSEVNAFIKEHKHLPDMPSEKEVKAEGLDLGEMNKKLLQKVEELTLYILKQDAQLKRHEQEIQQLKSSVKKR